MHLMGRYSALSHKASPSLSTRLVEVRGRQLRLMQGGRATGDAALSVDELLEDVRRSADLNPEAARAAAVELVTILTVRAAAGSAASRGGLAPWQKRKVDRYMREH